MNERTKITGKTMKFGDNMNTDVIIPSKYLEDPDQEIYCQYVMAAINPDTYKNIQEIGDSIFVGGKDFGSGSSREQAPEAIKYAGVKAVIAESFASIFFRNSINVGLPIIELKDAKGRFNEMDEIELKIMTGEIKNKTQARVFYGKKIEPFLLNKLMKGGLIPELREYVKENGLDKN